MVTGLSPARKPPTPSPEAQTPFSAIAPAAPFLVGHGYDIHRIEPAKQGSGAPIKPLVICGVVVTDELTPVAHSDGDVVLHAIADALLGATGQGDIGEVFQPTDPRWKDVASRMFVDNIYASVKRLGYHLSNVDVTLLLERPKVAPFKPQMKAYLHELFGPAAQLNLKAGTNEGCDAVGRGEAVAATAVVLLAADR
jgi:2-C-methyl-D-erythritol 2,4-cyclodiphosphate synthase